MKKFCTIFFLFFSSQVFLSSYTALDIQQDFLAGRYWQVISGASLHNTPSAQQQYMTALSFFFTGQTEQAIPLLQNIVSRHAVQFPGSIFWLALSYIENNQKEQVLTLLTSNNLSAMPSSLCAAAENLLAALQGEDIIHHDPQALLIYATGKQSLADHAKAIEVLQSVIETKNPSLIPYALFYQARSYLALNRKREARSRYQLITTMYADSPMASAAHYAQSRLLSGPEKSTLLNTLVQSTHATLERLLARLDMATQAARVQNTQQIKSFIDGQSTNEEKSRLIYILAIAAAKSSTMKTQTVDLLAQIQNIPSTIIAIANYAQAYHLTHNNNYLQAKEILEQNPALREKISWSDPVVLYLINLRKLNLLPVAAKLLDKLSAENTGRFSWLVYFYLSQGWVFTQQGKTDQAISQYTLVTNVSDNVQIKAEAMYNTALVYIQKKEFARAEEYFAQVHTNTGKTYPEILETLALAQAIAAFKANQTDKVELLAAPFLTSSGTTNRPWHILLAGVYTSQGYFAKAAKIYTTLAAQSGYVDASEAAYLAALNTYRASDSRAIGLFTQIIQQGHEPDNNKAAYFWLAKSYELQANWTQAIKYYQMSLDINIRDHNKTFGRMVGNHEAASAMLVAMLKNDDSRLISSLQQMRQKDPQISDQLALTLAEEATALQNYALALSLFQEIQDKNFRLTSMFGQAVNLEALGKNGAAVDIYVQYLQQDHSSYEALLVARKIGELADQEQLSALIFNSKNLILPPQIQAPLVLAWVNFADKNQKSKVQKTLKDLPLKELDELERSQLNLVQARYYKRIKDYPQALASYNAALNLALSPQQYVTARRERSEIYEHQGKITDAVKELLLVEQAFRSHPAIAAQALYEAGLVFSRHQMSLQHDVIKKTLKERYPDTPQASRI